MATVINLVVVIIIIIIIIIILEELLEVKLDNRSVDDKFEEHKVNIIQCFSVTSFVAECLFITVGGY